MFLKSRWVWIRRLGSRLHYLFSPIHSRMRNPFRRTSVAIVLLAALNPQTTWSRTWIVAPDGSGDFMKVQSGIDAAQEGDSVLVAPGTYVENIRFRGRDIVLKSQSGLEMTILDGRLQDRSVVEFLNGESNACVLEGFTITGGRGSSIVPGEKIGGGIVIQDAEPSIVRNRITGNTAISSSLAGAGGGIFCRAAHPDQSQPLRIPRIIGNVIQSNMAGLNAGGIGLQEKVSAIIIANEISRNQTGRGDGGGIWIFVRQNPEIVIEDNRIIDNEANDHGGGILAATPFHGPSVTLPLSFLRNIVARNTAKGSAGNGAGGGGMLLSCVSGRIASNTIVSNVGEAAGGSGGGIVLSEPSSPLIERNVIALNTRGGVLCQQSATPIIEDNLVWGNDGGDGFGPCGEWISLNGNVQADPLFCDVVREDYSLPAKSPALTHSAGPIGAIVVPGCDEGVIVESTTWGALKARWRSTNWRWSKSASFWNSR